MTTEADGGTPTPTPDLLTILTDSAAQTDRAAPVLHGGGTPGGWLPPGEVWWGSFMETFEAQLEGVRCVNSHAELEAKAKLYPELVEALEKIARGPDKPFPDAGAHSWSAYAHAVFDALVRAERIADAVLAKVKP